jgi:hypothetical protein
MEADLLFYDAEVEPLCAQFCERLHISQMPCVQDRKRYYKWNGQRFEGPFLAADARHLKPDQFPFAKEVKKQFQGQGPDALFVIDEAKEIVGVVHIADYNKAAAQTFLYEQILAFEQLLRSYLHVIGRSNADLMGWLKAGKKENPYFQKMLERLQQPNYAARMAELRPFQAFHLSDLLNYIHHSKVLALKPHITQKVVDDIHQIKTLRDRIMHSQDMVGRDEALYYDLASLESAIDQYQLIHAWRRQVAEEIWRALEGDRRERNRIRLGSPEYFLEWLGRAEMNQ